MREYILRGHGLWRNETEPVRVDKNIYYVEGKRRIISPKKRLWEMLVKDMELANVFY